MGSDLTPVDYLLLLLEALGLKSPSEHLEQDPTTGMWCRMCGGACDLINCGMEQP